MCLKTHKDVVMFQKYVSNVLKLWSEMFKMCKIIKIAFKKQVFRKKKFGSAEFFSLRGGSLSHTLKTPALEYLWYKGWDEFRIINMNNA